jgi:hypothetical protein
MEYVKEVAEHLLPIVALILSGVLTVLGTYVLRRLSKFLGVKVAAEQEAMVASTVHRGVGYAEEWARTRVRNGEQRPGGAAKMETALDYVDTVLRKYKVPKLAHDEIVKRVESALGEQILLRDMEKERKAERSTLDIGNPLPADELAARRRDPL